MPAYGYKHAIKHGLYSRRLSKEEIELIGATPILDVDGEIGYLRAVINRLGNIAEHNGLAPDSTDGLTLDTRSTVKLMEQAMGRLLSYVRLRNMLKSDLTEYRAEIERGKMIGRERMHVFEYFKPPAPEAPAPPAQKTGARRKPGTRKKRAAADKDERRDE